MIEKFCKRDRGSVSVFLAIILVPMLTIAALFVDASKIKMAKGVAASATDLALNTALTDYDTMLKDMYGLFATAQDTDELYTRLEDYYRTCITSAGINDVDAQNVVEQLMAQLGAVEQSGNISDLLNMELIDFTASKVSGGNLANAAIMKNQIVEFMKYRSPVNTGLSFISSINAFKTLSKQTELVEDRTKYYEEEKNVLDTLKNAWIHIEEYNQTEIGTNGETYLNSMLETVKVWEGEYRKYHNYTIKDLVAPLDDRNSFESYFSYIWNVEKHVKADGKNIYGVRVPYPNDEDENGNTIEDWWKIFIDEKMPYYTYVDFMEKGMLDINGNIIKSYSTGQNGSRPTEEEIESLINSFEESYNKVQSDYATLKAYMQDNTENEHIFQFLAQAKRFHSLDKYTTSVVNMHMAYQKLKYTILWAEKDTYDKAKWLQLEKDYASEMQFFKNMTEEFKRIASEGAYKYQINNELKATNDGLKNIKNKIVEYESELDKAINALEGDGKETGAITKLKKAVSSLKEGGALEKARSEWISDASDNAIKDTSMAKQDKAEAEEAGKYLNIDSLNALIGRLENICQNLKNVKSQLAGYKYNGAELKSISNYRGLFDKLKVEIRDIPVNQSELNKKVEEWWNFTSGNLNVSWTNNSGNQPDLTKDKVKMYSYLYNKFHDETTNQIKTEKADSEGNTGKDLYDKIKDNKAADNNLGNYKDSPDDSKDKKEIVGQPNLPSSKPVGSNTQETDSIELKSGKNSEKLSSTSAGLSTLFSKIKDVGTDFRDNMYVADYALSMFSYDTLINEVNDKYRIKNAIKDNSKNDQKAYSLTYYEINNSNNYLYGSEVEYIIYGKTAKSSVNTAYGTIYAIRLGFNLVYAFMDSGIRETALAIATPISAATLGIIPAPLIQAAIIIGMACVESAWDLDTLKKGETVPLYKNKATWRCSVDGLINYAKGKLAEVAENTVDGLVDYTANGLSDLLNMADDELEKYIKENSGKLKKNLIDAYDSMVANNAEMAIQQMTTLVNSAIEEFATETQDRAQKIKTQVETGLRNWINNSTDTGIILQAKQIAVDTIINGGYLDEVIEKFSAAKNVALDAVETAKNTLNGVIEKIRIGISGAINDAEGIIQDTRKNITDTIAKGINDGADKFKQNINGMIDGWFGGSGSTQAPDQSGIASLLAFRYSDYLRLFLVISLYCNEENTILRIGDVIQSNLNIKQDGFLLEKSAAYVKVDATIQVKPVFLALPIFADVENNPASDTNWYTIHIKEAIRGY